MEKLSLWICKYVLYIWLDAEWCEEFNSSGIIFIECLKYAEVINASSAAN